MKRLKTVLVNGREVQVDPNDREASIVEVEPGVYSVLLNGRSFEARVGVGTVEVNGETFTTEVVDPRAPHRQRGVRAAEGRQTLTAPMPGKVVRLLAREVQTLEAGQGILVIEAMKMQNEIQSLRAGILISLPVKEGDTVGAGETLAVVE